MQEAIKAGEERLESEGQRASEALKQASEAAMAEHEALRAKLSESQAVRGELEAKVARAAGSLKAADELRDAK